MNRAKYISRTVFLLITILLLVYLNTKTEDNVESIAEFKFKMIEKLGKDSLNAKQKLDLFQNETTKFIDDSSHVKEGIRYLMGLLALLVIFELVFFLQKERNTEG